MKSNLLLSSFVTLTISWQALANNGSINVPRTGQPKLSKKTVVQAKSKKMSHIVTVQGQRVSKANAKPLTKMQGPTTSKNAASVVSAKPQNLATTSSKKVSAKSEAGRVDKEMAAASRLEAPTATPSVANSQTTKTSVLASENTSTLAVPAAPAAKKDVSFSGTFSITREAQIKNQVDKESGEVSRSENLGYELVPALKTWDYTTRAIIVYNQDLKSPGASEVQDIPLSFTRAPFDVSKYFKMNYGLTSVIPMTKKTKEEFELNTNAGVMVGTAVNTAAMGVPGLTLKASLTTSRNFHKATTSVKGEPLTQYSLLKKFAAGYEIGSFSITALFWHYSNYSYENVVREKFLHNQELGYKINDHFSVALGLYNDAPMYRPTTYEYNLKFVDDESSMMYGKVEASF